MGRGRFNIVSAFSLGRFSPDPHWPVLPDPRGPGSGGRACATTLAAFMDFAAGPWRATPELPRGAVGKRIGVSHVSEYLLADS